MTLQEYLTSLRHKTVAVIGIGVSNTPLLRRLLAEGIAVTACDRSSREKLGPLADELEAAGATLRLVQQIWTLIQHSLRCVCLTDSRSCIQKIRRFLSSLRHILCALRPERYHLRFVIAIHDRPGLSGNKNSACTVLIIIGIIVFFRLNIRLERV